ncbi:MFS transporter [Nguyenibacter vanlangensis]|uniref:MFS transporter n=1 Tax=Nguyenibacter vanlangensis TaxID=1216886 RepID=A0ABZ3D041_9PROT
MTAVAEAEVSAVQSKAAATSSISAIIAAVLGNALEVYDFTVYSFFSTYIARAFFPDGSELLSLLVALATFGVGFFARPFGAAIIGHYADRHGRKPALTLTIGLMVVGTAAIAFAPDYARFGIAASLLVVIGRLLQGFSSGGEIGTATTLLLESASRDRRCELVSWQAASQGGAALFGALVGVSVHGLMSEASMQAWGWRVPFLIALLIGPLGLYIRSTLRESAPPAEAVPVRWSGIFVSEWKTLLQGILLMAGSTVSTYIMIYYMPVYLVRSLGFSQTIAFSVPCIAGLAILVIGPLGGRLADRLGLRKSLPMGLGVFQMLLIFPLFHLLASEASPFIILSVMALFFATGAIGTGAGTALMIEAFPCRHRAAGMSISYSCGVTIFGGFAPMIVTWLIAVTHNVMAPAWYLFAAMMVSMMTVIFFPSENTE